MSAVSEAVVLMAGSGSRLSGSAAKSLKPLTTVLGRPLISYLFDALADAGISAVHAVVGYESERMVERVEPLVPSTLRVRFVENPHWQKQNGLSVLAAAGRVKAPFLLTMSDHLFERAAINRLLDAANRNELNVAVDRKINTIVDLADAMKVRTDGDRVVMIGKELGDYDAIDTGLFVSSEELFTYLEAAKRNGDCSLSDGVRQMAADRKVGAIDIGDAWWQDVDTPMMLSAAEKHLRLRRGDAFIASAAPRT